MDLKAQQVQDARRRRLISLMVLIVSQVVYYYNLIFLTPNAPILYHTSILTGEGWMLELLNGHPDRIWTCLGVTHDIFDKLVRVLMRHGMSSSRASIEEQLGIFLYTCVTGLSSRHVAERFQHSPHTITKSVIYCCPYFPFDFFSQDTSKRCCFFSRTHRSTGLRSSSQQKTCQSRPRSLTTHASVFSVIVLARSMAHTSEPSWLSRTNLTCATGRDTSHRTVYSFATLIFFLYTRLLDGMAPPRMPIYGMTRIHRTCRCHGGSTY